MRIATYRHTAGVSWGATRDDYVSDARHLTKSLADVGTSNRRVVSGPKEQQWAGDSLQSDRNAQEVPRAHFEQHTRRAHRPAPATNGSSASWPSAGSASVRSTNGLLSVERPELAQELASQLGAAQVRAYVSRWLAELPQPLSAEDRERGYGYACSLKQIEIADTRVFDRPLRGRQWFEATIAEQLALGRPQEIALLLDRRVTRRTPGRFETHVLADHTIPEILFRYKHSTIKQYLKGGRALRTETTVNDTYDLGIGRALEHLGEVRERGDAINQRLLAAEASSEEARLSGPERTELVLPRRTAGRRVPALRFGDPRVMALLAAVVACANLPAGFQNAQLRRPVAALLSLSLEEYSPARIADSGRIRSLTL